MINDTDADRGQVGIGTLIVFIAMVLVAAIAAGVLVNTAGFLQATAEDTGQESVNQVTNRLDVVSQHGVVNDSDPANYSATIDELRLAVRMSSGSGELALQNSTIKYTSETTATNLVYNNSTINSGTEVNRNNITSLQGDEFTVVDKNDNGDSYPVLDEESDRFEIVINASNVEGADKNGLGTSESLQLELTTRSGGTTNVVLTMPHQLNGEDDDDPVPL
ncbi:flagellin [Halobellus salinus]|uniref:Flagellin n=1 Tax=Halobellus salinus TaxID=931585 RepID=A0A830EPL8_9EURY|nr:archaellin/type IV pilin N-terminal domain-containing protein [Halobellus salinus]GGJ04834.1 flagellin [Halobellus salinus]SMP09388.1 flagellin FlaB [Halobellus salinus]